jgi:hypothetical protein
MSSSNQVRFVDRVQFFAGQRLLAGDLQALEELQREMRWLHNRSLHQPGVASGFAVRGSKGDSVLVIEPGYAIDALGRELVLGRSHEEPVPPVASDGAGNPLQYDLTVSYSASLPIVDERGGACDDNAGSVRVREMPVFCWAEVGAPDAEPLRREIEKGLRILLARVEILNCRIHSVSIAQRRNAKPSNHPFVFASEAEVEWTIEPSAQSPFGIRLHPSKPVDTRAAGFRTSPSYFVHLSGAQSIELVRGASKVTMAIDGFVEVFAVQQESFELAVSIPNALFQGTSVNAGEVRKALEALVKANELSWRIGWLGVEG